MTPNDQAVGLTPAGELRRDRLAESLHDARILLIDDQPANVALLERLLRREGYGQIRVVTDSRQALRVVASYRPDLVVLDLQMPHPDGFAVMAALPELLPDADILPVLAVTGHGGAAVRDRALGSGAWDFLTKPLDRGEVLVRVRNLLEARVLHLRDRTQGRALAEQLVHAQRMELIGRLVGGIAHDFNNLLTAIRGGADLILLDAEQGPIRDEAREIVRASERAASLARQLLGFARRDPPRSERVDMNRVVAGAREMLARLLGAEIELETTLDPALPPVLSDPAQVEQVVVNLAVNARDAMGGRGRITIRTRRENGAAALEVGDTGPGMAEEVRERIFEPYFTTKKRGEGTGLGLAIVSGIVTSARGRIEVETAPGQGTTFRIILPAV